MEESLSRENPAIEELSVSGGAGSGNVADPYLMNGLTLAYIGDAVFELLARQHMLATGSRQVDKLHKHTTAAVNAKAQSHMIMALMTELSEREISVFKRGRNSSTVTAAKHQSINDYRRATGLEALFGYLYLNGETDRLKNLFSLGMKALERLKAEQPSG